MAPLWLPRRSAAAHSEAMTSTLAPLSWFRRAVRPPAALPRSFELLAGQQQAVDLEPGDMLRVADGCVHLCLPARWLAETLVRPSQTLRAGDAYRCREGETVTLVAIGTSRVRRA
jgi:hypothetical protein